MNKLILKKKKTTNQTSECKNSLKNNLEKRNTIFFFIKIKNIKIRMCQFYVWKFAILNFRYEKQ